MCCEYCEFYDINNSTECIRMNLSENLNNSQTIRQNCCSPGVEVSPMSDRELRTLKGEVKNLRQTIVDTLADNGLQDITQILSLLAEFRCDPIYKYPSFDFIRMYLYCYMVSCFFFCLMTCIFNV